MISRLPIRLRLALPFAVVMAALLALTGFLIYVPACQELLGTAALPAKDLLLVLPFPFIVWGPTS